MTPDSKLSVDLSTKIYNSLRAISTAIIEFDAETDVVIETGQQWDGTNDQWIDTANYDALVSIKSELKAAYWSIVNARPAFITPEIKAELDAIPDPAAAFLSLFKD